MQKLFSIATKPCFGCQRWLSSSSNVPPRFGATTFATASLQKPEVTAVCTKFSEPLSVNELPLSEPMHLKCPLIFAELPSKESDVFHTSVTVLENGLKVASEPKFGEFCTIGVLFDAGSRYEAEYPSGISHFIEKLAYSSSKQFPDRSAVHSLLEKYGGIVDCQTTRDTFLFASSCHSSGVEPVTRLLADVSVRPNITDEEFASVREVVRFDIEDMNRNPNAEQILMDWIHQAAYRDNTLGLPKFCPLENVEKISKSHLFTFMKNYFVPSRAVVAGVGVDHNELVAAARKYFVSEKAVWDENANLFSSHLKPMDSSIAQYTGGEVKVKKDLSSVALGPTPMPELAHFVLGLESCSYKDADFVPFCVLNSLMGGGGSFSAGGPGKGMYTRLYLNVLNKFHWMYNATSYNHVYSDSGVFCIHASSDPEKLPDLVRVVISEFHKIAEAPAKEELQRAKTQLKSMLLMNLEQRPVMFEDVGRQVLGHGLRKTPFEYITEIDKVGANDIQRIGERLLKAKASVVGYGSLDSLPDYAKIDQAVAKRDLSLLKPARFFTSF